MSGPKFIFQQSLANSDEAIRIESLLDGYPGLRLLRQTRTLTSGYSGARVYLALAETAGTPAAHWILKVGDAADLGAESAGYDVAKATPAGQNAVTKIGFYSADNVGLLVYDFAGLQGHPPLDLEAGIDGFWSRELLESALKTVGSWLSQPEWRDDVHLTKQLQEWSFKRLGNLPQQALSLKDTKTIYVSDLGTALANPIFYIGRSILPRLTGRVPYAFTHGDLNLRNVLFPTTATKDPLVDQVRFIDFRHAGTAQWAVVDLAKLESCLRYQWLRTPESQADLAETLGFLNASCDNLELKRPPEILGRNKQLQDNWRGIAAVRERVKGLAAQNADAERSYWIALIAYALTYAAYDTQDEFSRNAAYLDAARLFTAHVVPADLKWSPQRPFVVQPGLSPEMQAGLREDAWASAAILQRSIQRGNAILVVGPYLGRTSGVEPLPRFLQNIHKEASLQAPSIDSVRALLANLGRQLKRHEVAELIGRRVANWQFPDELVQMANARWAAVVSLHFHGHVRAALRRNASVVAVDGQSQLGPLTDSVESETTLYFPFFGDPESSSESLPLTLRDFSQRIDTFSELVDLCRRRFRSMSLVFWRCEDLSPEIMMDLRAAADTHGETVDAYLVTDQENRERDAGLQAAGIVTMIARLEEVTPQSSGVIASPREPGNYWHRGDNAFPIPALGRQSSGLLEMFGDLGAISAAKGEEGSFLLGGPATIQDIEDGRVLRRRIVEDAIIPAIQSALLRGNERVRWVFVAGRPGAGVSTCLSIAAQRIWSQQLAPCIVVARPEGHDRASWTKAGELVAETSNATKRPCVLVLDAATHDFPYLDRIAQGVLDRRGELVIVVGGRTDVVGRLKDQLDLKSFHNIPVPDTLHPEEWRALARTLQSNGYSSHASEEDLARRMGHVGLLLPAIYEATDRKNRKFQEIVAHEYYRYSRDQMVQRAYRLICTAGAFDVEMSQYWLLKAVGGVSINEATRLLSTLHSEIVMDSGSSFLDGDIGIRARHRLIAEEVLRAAAPNPEHRLADVRTLIDSANLASRKEGGSALRLLARKGLFFKWLNETFGPDRFRLEVIELFETVLSSGAMVPILEITACHHYALVLVGVNEHDSALVQAKRAYMLDPLNPASAHVMALVHQAKALQAWSAAAEGGLGEAARAKSEEQEAMEFFQQARQQQPNEEYGYEAEARYLRRKFETLTRVRIASRVPTEWLEDARTGLARGLRLLSEAEVRVRKDGLHESMTTKARLLSSIGEFESACALLSSAIGRATDSVHRDQLRELLAGLAAASERWEVAREQATCLIDAGVRSAYVFLILDDALRKLKVDDERARRARESAEEWNREDVETLMRWATICVQREDYRSARRTLDRALRSAQRQGYSTAEQLRRRGLLMDGAKPARRTGRVERLFKPFEGLIRIEGTSDDGDIYFRVADDHKNRLMHGDIVEFGVSCRIRGLKAEDVRLAKE